MKNEVPAATVEKTDAPKDRPILEKFGRFVDYTSPTMKELLCHVEGRMHLTKS